MISIQQVSKHFEEFAAVSDVSLEIAEKQVFGLIGTNGAGKSTLLRMIAGVYRAEEGEILIDGERVYDNPAAKSKIFFIADDPAFGRNSTAVSSMQFYRNFYPGFDTEKFQKLLQEFHLDPRRKILQYSKGMKKQLSLLLGLCSSCKYLICDETFDGLDPMMRQAVKSLFAKEMLERGLTPVIASHNLRELEDICDHVGLLHQGGVLLSEDLLEMKTGRQKLQVVFPEEVDYEALKQELQPLREQTSGRLHLLTIRGSREEVLAKIEKYQPVFAEILPLSLEEMFIHETEVVGYDIKKLIL